MSKEKDEEYEDWYAIQQGRFDTGVHIPSRKVPE